MVLFPRRSRALAFKWNWESQLIFCFYATNILVYPYFNMDTLLRLGLQAYKNYANQVSGNELYSPHSYHRNDNYYSASNQIQRQDSILPPIVKQVNKPRFHGFLWNNHWIFLGIKFIQQICTWCSWFVARFWIWRFHEFFETRFHIPTGGYCTRCCAGCCCRCWCCVNCCCSSCWGR